MIRTYNTEDLEAVMHIWQKASVASHSFLTEKQSEDEAEKIKNKYIVQSKTWVYESDSELLGFISMLNSEIGGLFVLPSHHRKGIGTSLIEFVRQRYLKLEVEVFSKNTLGLSFYLKLGFKVLPGLPAEAYGNPLIRFQLDINKSNIR